MWHALCRVTDDQELPEPFRAFHKDFRAALNEFESFEDDISTKYDINFVRERGHSLATIMAPKMGEDDSHSIFEKLQHPDIVIKTAEQKFQRLLNQRFRYRIEKKDEMGGTYHDYAGDPQKDDILTNEIRSCLQQIYPQLMQQYFPEYVQEKKQQSEPKPQEKCDVDKIEQNIQWPGFDGPGNDYY